MTTTIPNTFLQPSVISAVPQRSMERSAVAETRWRVWLYAGSVLMVGILVVAAVLATGMTVRTSYERAQLQQRSVQAQKELRRLEEQHALVTSLPALLSYANEHGYTEASAPVAAVEVNTPVAHVVGAAHHD